MGVRCIRFGDLAPVPWKNGAGITRELLRYEHDGHLAARLSVADVDRDCAFSEFPGLHRILTVLTGDGFRLVGDGIDAEARHMRPLPFPGDIPLECSLFGGPVRDLNVIYAPKLCEAQVDVLDLSGGRRVVPTEGGTLALFCAGEVCDVSGTRLEQFDIAIADGDVAAEGGMVVAVRLRMRSV